MSGPTVDWARAEQEERRRQWTWAAPVVVGYAGGIFLALGRSPFGPGRAGWLALAGYVVFMIVLIAIIRSRPQVRARNAGVRAQAALRLHADPGPGPREQADRLARSPLWQRWFPLLLLIAPLGVVTGGRWDHLLPTACGLLLLLGATAAFFLWWRTGTAEARRWVADPPGPPRDMPAPTRSERWAARWMTPLIAVGLALSGIGAVLRGITALLD